MECQDHFVDAFHRSLGMPVSIITELNTMNHVKNDKQAY